MITRAILFGLIATVSLTSGCACCDNPCWGFRLHPWSNCGAPCGCAPCGCAPCACPAYASPVVAGPAYRLPSDCPTCGPVPSVIPHAGAPGTGYPATGYPPIISNPMPLPGYTPPDLIPSAMPMGRN